MELTNRPDFIASVDARILASLLGESNIGDTVSYQALSSAIGRNILSNRSVLYTALSILQREKQMVFAAVRGIGMKRLDNEGIVDLGDASRSRIRRIATTTRKKLSCVNYNAMSKEAQVKHNTSISVLGVLAEISTEKSFSRISSKVAETKSTLAAAKASLAAFQ